MIPKNAIAITGGGSVAPPIPVATETYFNGPQRNNRLSSGHRNITFNSSAVQTDTWSVSVKMRFTDITASHGIIGDSNSNYYLSVDPVNGRIILRGAGGVQVFSTGFTFIADAWYQIDVVCDNLTTYFYVDNVEGPVSPLTSATGAAPIYNWEQVGAIKNIINFRGGIAWIGFWQDYLLTSEERTALFNETSTVEEVGVGFHYLAWNLSYEGTQRDIIDLSGSGIDGYVEDTYLDSGFDGYFLANDVGGKALQFNDENKTDLISCINQPIDVLTWTMHFRVNGNGNSGYVYGREGASRLGVGIGTTSMTVRHGSGSALTFTMPSRTSDTYYTYMVSTDGAGGVRVYMDGIESVDGLKIQSGFSNGINWVQLGYCNFAPASEYDGLIDRITGWYDYTGTQIDATNLYNGGVPLEPSTIIASPAWDYDMEQAPSDRTIYRCVWKTKTIYR